MRNKQKGELGLLILLLLALMTLAAKRLPDLGSKHPEEEEVIFTKQRNLVTGELRNVQIVRCRVCNQVISFIEFDHTGKPIGGHVWATHRCGYLWGSHEPYAGMGIGPKHFDFWKWLDSWQKRLSHER